MLKAVVIDDEDIIREGLAEDVPWKKLGMRLVGQAENGEQGLRLIQRQKPEVIVTDVRMPFLDGLQLIERVKKELPDSYVIIISGHDEFKYAQQALRLGAFDYILKPIDLKYFEQLLARVRESHQRKRKQDRSLRLLAKNVLADIMSGLIAENQVQGALQSFDVNLKAEFWTVVILHLDRRHRSPDGSEEEFEIPFFRWFNQRLNDLEAHFRVVVVRNSSHEYIAVILSDDREEARRIAAEITGTVRLDLQSKGEVTITAGIGETQDRIEKLPLAFRQASEALNLKYMLGPNRDIFFSGSAGMLNTDFIRELDADVLLETHRRVEDLIGAIRKGGRESVQDLIVEFEQELQRQAPVTVPLVKFSAHSMLFQLLNFLRGRGLTPQDVQLDPLEAYKVITNSETAHEAFRHLAAYVSRIIDRIELRRDRYGEIVEKVRAYVEDNYSRCDLSLEEVAEQVGVSYCHLSEIFKRTVGITFIEHLMDLRIQKAKDLIASTPMRFYEISYAVGYENPAYFSELFKRRVGMTPTDYKTRCVPKEGRQ